METYSPQMKPGSASDHTGQSFDAYDQRPMTVRLVRVIAPESVDERGSTAGAVIGMVICTLCGAIVGAVFAGWMW